MFRNQGLFSTPICSCFILDDLIFNHKAVVLCGNETTLVRVDPGVRLDAKAIYDKEFLLFLIRNIYP